MPLAAEDACCSLHKQYKRATTYDKCTFVKYNSELFRLFVERDLREEPVRKISQDSLRQLQLKLLQRQATQACLKSRGSFTRLRSLLEPKLGPDNHKAV